MNPGPTQTGFIGTQKANKFNIQNKTFVVDLAVCKSCCFVAQEAGQQSESRLKMVIKPLILIRATIWEWVDDRLVK